MWLQVHVSHGSFGCGCTSGTVRYGTVRKREQTGVTGGCCVWFCGFVVLCDDAVVWSVVFDTIDP